ncbi:MFS transporter [Rhodovibrionaceae bacterium A322]
MPAAPAPSAPVHSRFFYGWVILAVAFVTMAVSVTARTGFSLFYPELLNEFGWDSAETAGAFSIGFVASTAFLPLIGLLMDRFGPRLLIPLGGILISSGYLLMTLVDSVLGLYATFGVLVVCGSMASSYIVHTMFIPNWFVRRKGLAIGLVFAGVGIGGIVLLPLLQWLIDDYGWRMACYVLVATILITLLPLNALFTRKKPEDMGLLADGDRPGEHATDSNEDSAKASQPDPIVNHEWVARDWTVKSAMATGRFWWLALGFSTGLFIWYAIQVHQTRFLLDVGFGPEVAATALGLVGLGGVAGQIGLGALSDRIGREKAWAISLLGYLGCSLLLLQLEQHSSLVLLYAMVGLQGLLGNGFAALYGSMPSEIFSGKHFSVIFSIIALIGNLGAGAGPWVFGLIYDAQGSYHLGFQICAVLSLVSILAIWLASPRKIRLVAGQARKRARLQAQNARSGGKVI